MKRFLTHRFSIKFHCLCRVQCMPDTVIAAQQKAFFVPELARSYLPVRTKFTKLAVARYPPLLAPLALESRGGLPYVIIVSLAWDKARSRVTTVTHSYHNVAGVSQEEASRPSVPRLGSIWRCGLTIPGRGVVVCLCQGRFRRADPPRDAPETVAIVRRHTAFLASGKLRRFPFLA